MRTVTVTFLSALSVSFAVFGGSSMEGVAGLQARVFVLQHANAKDAVPLLRTIAAVEQLELLEGRRVRVTGSPEDLAVAAVVVRLFDVAPDRQSAIESYSVPSEGSVITRFPLQYAPAPDVSLALRTELTIQSVAVSVAPALVIIRDSREKTSAAEELIRSMERSAQESMASEAE